MTRPWSALAYHADRCTVTTDDPRVGGSSSFTWNMDLWGRLGISRELVPWGTQRLENDDGAWEGRATGVAYYPSSPGDIIANCYRGTCGYAGLSYFELWTGFEPWMIQWPQQLSALARRGRTRYGRQRGAWPFRGEKSYEAGRQTWRYLMPGEYADIVRSLPDGIGGR